MVRKLVADSWKIEKGLHLQVKRYGKECVFMTTSFIAALAWNFTHDPELSEKHMSHYRELSMYL